MYVEKFLQQLFLALKNVFNFYVYIYLIDLFVEMILFLINVSSLVILFLYHLLFKYIYLIFSVALNVNEILLVL